MTKKIKRLSKKDLEFIQDKREQDWSLNQIADAIGFSKSAISDAVTKFKFMKGSSGKLPTEIRRSLENSGSFGKICMENNRHIKTLLRIGAPPNLVADLIGLRYAPGNEEFYELEKIGFIEECKQARAEYDINLIILASTDPKPSEALRLLTSGENTRQLYKAPKEEKSAIEIRFPGFSRNVTTKIISDND